MNKFKPGQSRGGWPEPRGRKLRQTDTWRLNMDTDTDRRGWMTLPESGDRYKIPKSGQTEDKHEEVIHRGQVGRSRQRSPLLVPEVSSQAPILQWQLVSFSQDAYSAFTLFLF